MKAWISLLAILLFSTGTAWADCGKAHGSEKYHKDDPHGMGRISATEFQDLDTDKSGGISFEEFKAAFSRTSENGFATLDKDGDKTLNQEEWQAFKKAHTGMGKGAKKPEDV